MTINVMPKCVEKVGVPSANFASFANFSLINFANFANESN